MTITEENIIILKVLSNIIKILNIISLFINIFITF